MRFILNTYRLFNYSFILNTYRLFNYSFILNTYRLFNYSFILNTYRLFNYSFILNTYRLFKDTFPNEVSLMQFSTELFPARCLRSFERFVIQQKELPLSRSCWSIALVKVTTPKLMRKVDFDSRRSFY